MTQFSTFRQTRDRLEKTIAGLSEPRWRTGLDDFFRHWWAEVVGDLDAAMAVFTSDVEFRSYGPLGTEITFSVDERRATYQAILDAGICVGGSWDGERFFFGDLGIVMEATWTFVHYGALIPDSATPVDAAGLYLVQRPFCIIMPLAEDGHLKGEILYYGAPSLVEPIDPADKDRLLGAIE